MVGNVLMALGAGLLLAMLVPRSFWTVLIGAALIVLGWLLGEKS